MKVVLAIDLIAEIGVHIVPVNQRFVASYFCTTVGFLV